MSELLAERWFQALRRWRTRTVRMPRPRPWKPRGSAAYLLRRSARCPVCRSERVDKYNELINYTIAAGKDLRRAFRLIADELGIRPYQVEWHFHNCMLQEVPAPLVGEWVYGGIEYVETPAGWTPSNRVLAAIREHPESNILLSVLHPENRRKTLLRHSGYYRDETARKIGQALLELAKSLGSTT